MNLIIKDDNFTTNNIKMKPCKNCIKLLYDLSFIKMIGLSFKINNYSLIKITNGLIRIKIMDKKMIKIINDIDTYLLNIYHQDYIRMITNNMLNIKRSDNSKISDSIILNINNLKKTNNKYYIQIYEINGR